MKRSVFDVNKIALIGVPSSAGARMVGQEQAPRCLRDSGLAEFLRSIDYNVVDMGDVQEATFSLDGHNPRQQNLERVSGVLSEVADMVDLAIRNRAWPLVVGGDCTVTIGVIAALTRRFADLGLIYFDGDVDMNTPETTLSGILDGMALAHILGKGADALSRMGTRYPLVEEQNVTLFGYNERAGGMDAVEIALLRDTPMAKFPVETIRGDAGTTAARALRELERRVDHILVHFDVDVLDSDEFSAVDVTHRSGLSLAQGQDVLKALLGSRKVVGLVLTEFNARKDTDGVLARRLSKAIQAAMGTRKANVSPKPPGIRFDTACGT